MYYGITYGDPRCSKWESAQTAVAALRRAQELDRAGDQPVIITDKLGGSWSLIDFERVVDPVMGERA